ncbi:hypothetical protein PUV47_19600 [Pseudovibrio exalbescens]|uniref:hypothetical protein n=1 Tax=Pseudovibrio exalbescens TaxID=197461 RepID=UPI002365A691|nr:hypothetical protein [Pseudovibrio exalbescens]MDD7912141.1 hypothetical protein [Pseudovibrio exalbescens]
MVWLWACLLLLFMWFGFGVAVTTMIVYGVFEGVALGPSVMATIVATGTCFLSALAVLVVLLLVRKVRPPQ